MDVATNEKEDFLERVRDKLRQEEEKNKGR
jgi:hypothetical protein